MPHRAAVSWHAVMHCVHCFHKAYLLGTAFSHACLKGVGVRPKSTMRRDLLNALSCNYATPLLMGKQSEGHAQKALDSPCANLYQASLKCESGRAQNPPGTSLVRYVRHVWPTSLLDWRLQVCRITSITETSAKTLSSHTKPVKSRRYCLYCACKHIQRFQGLTKVA